MQSEDLRDRSRLKPTSFTRNRLLDFPTVLVIPFSGLRGAVQSEPDQFFATLRDRGSLARKVTQQAFSKARYQISALVFDDINRHLLKAVEKHLTVPRWHGCRVVAAVTEVTTCTVQKTNPDYFDLE